MYNIILCVGLRTGVALDPFEYVAPTPKKNVVNIIQLFFPFLTKLFALDTGLAGLSILV